MVLFHKIQSGFVAAVCIVLFSTGSPAVMPSDPVTDPQFLILSDGTNLADIKVRNTALYLAKGTGTEFGATQMADYQKLKQDSKIQPEHPVQWVLMDLDNHQIVDQSANPDKIIFGASVAKVFVAGTLMDQQNGVMQKSQWPLFADMLVVSDNKAWTDLQKQIGAGDSDLGRTHVQLFTQKMGYSRTKGFQGNLGSLHGNELNATDLVHFLYDTYHAHYPGAETVWKVMHTLRTATSRGFKYIPRAIFLAGKTGTYDGPTINPDTGGTTNPDGSAYQVRVRHQLMVMHVKGHHYGLAILANTGSNESAALIAGGLYREL